MTAILGLLVGARILSASRSWPSSRRTWTRFHLIGTLLTLRNRFSGRRGRTASEAVGDDEEDVNGVRGGIVRAVEGSPDPSEPLQGWTHTGPFVVDVPAAGGVVGVSGPGVLRAAMAALVAQERNKVIITSNCVAELYGTAGAPSQARVVVTSDQAIEVMHAELAERVRSQKDESAGCHGPMWLFARADDQPARLRALLDEAVPYEIYAILAGRWPFGFSLTVEDDGRVISASPEAIGLTGAHLAHLPPAPAQDDARLAGPQTRPGPGGRASTAETEVVAPPSGRTAVTEQPDVNRCGRKPRLRILGPVAISVSGRCLPGLLERRFSWEIATYLACHPEGATLDAIIEDLWPTEPLQSARKRFSDALYQLRKALREATGEPEKSFVVLRMNRYQLDSDLVETDLWDFDSAIQAGRISHSDAEKLENFELAVDLHCGNLVHIGDGAWAEPFQHDLRRKVVAALEAVASLLERDNPGMAITALERAARIAPCGEDADRNIMRIYHRLHRIDDIRTAYEALRERLGRIGEEPSVATRELLDSLTSDIKTAI